MAEYDLSTENGRSQAEAAANLAKRRKKFERDKARIQDSISKGLRGGPFDDGQGSWTNYKELVAAYNDCDNAHDRRRIFQKRCESGANGLMSTDPRWKDRKKIGGGETRDKFPPGSSEGEDAASTNSGNMAINKRAAGDNRNIRWQEKAEKTQESASLFRDVISKSWLYVENNPMVLPEGGTTDAQIAAMVEPHINTQAKLSWLLIRIAYNEWEANLGHTPEKIQMINNYAAAPIVFNHVFGKKNYDKEGGYPLKDIGRDLYDEPYESRFKGTDFLAAYYAGLKT